MKFYKQIGIGLVAAWFSTSAVHGQECLHWREEATTSIEYPRRYETVAFDSFRNQTVLVGGDDYPDPNKTWGWDGSQWNLLALGGIPRRSYASGAFDSDRGVMVVFGGVGWDNAARGVPQGNTWEWDGFTWSLRADSGPLPRSGHCMAYDSKRNVTVLFGGIGDFGPFGSTWEWDGFSWELVAGEGPPARLAFACTYDSQREVYVIFGGFSDKYGTEFLGDTWEWNGQTWKFRTDSGPIPRSFAAMAYDAGRGVSVLHGGGNNEIENFALGDTSEWDGFEWRQVPAPFNPHLAHAMVYDSSRGRLVVVGGIGTEDKLFELVRVDNAADADADCDGDLVDFAEMQTCFGELDAESECGVFDTDQNGTVDTVDLKALIPSLTGPGL